MTPKTETLARRVLITVGSTLLVALLTAAASAAWMTKENTDDHAKDMAVVNTTLQRILDAVCDGNVQKRACK